MVTDTNKLMNYKEAEKLLEEGKAEKCIDYFKKNNHILEYAYALVLTGDTDKAQEVLKTIDSVRSDWLKKLIPMMKGYVMEYPTYFQIRNFLEIDLTMLIKSGRIEDAQYILGAADVFQEINSESYKFIARAMLKNGYSDMSKQYLDKSSFYYYNDVELHYLYVEYYLYKKDFENAKNAVEKCLKINPEYFPAKKTKALLDESGMVSG